MSLGINSRKFWKLGVKREVPQFINTDRKGEKKTKQWFRHRNWRFWRFQPSKSSNLQCRVGNYLQPQNEAFLSILPAKEPQQILAGPCAISCFFRKEPPNGLSTRHLPELFVVFSDPSVPWFQDSPWPAGMRYSTGKHQNLSGSCWSHMVCSSVVAPIPLWTE